MSATQLERMDSRVHRCTGCGSWTYSTKPCTTCQAPAP